METANKFGERLLTLREQRNETQEQLAKAINITRQSLSRYETNERTPNIDLIYRIAKHYEISSDYLLGLTESPTIEPTKSAAEKYIGLSPEATEYLADMQNCDFNVPYKRTDILNMLILNRYFRNMLDDICELCCVAGAENLSSKTKYKVSGDGKTIEFKELSKEYLKLIYVHKALNGFYKIVEAIIKEVTSNAQHNPEKE